MAKCVQRVCHDTLPWLISFSLGRMRVALLCFLLIVPVVATVSAAKQGGTPDSRAAKAAAEEWLRRMPEFAAKIGKEPRPTLTRIKDHDHAVVLKTSWPPG